VKTYEARGIVLHTMRYGENSLIVFMLTDVIGRQNYLIQGLRNGKNNKTALYQPMFVVDFVGLESPRLQMHRMKEAINAMPLHTVPFDVRKSTIALFMAETLYRLVREAEPQSPLFDFVTESIAALDALDSDAATANFHLWFLVNLSFHLGFYPGNEYLPGGWFDIREGLFAPRKPSHGLVLDPDNALILNVMMITEPSELGTIQLSRTSRAAFLTAMLTYFGYHLDATNNIRSIEILRDVF
jgi:DNA repair protein RecO (recombination protein O)